MKKLSQKHRMKEQNGGKYRSFRELVDREKADIVRECNSCGACLQVCPVYRYTSFSHERPVAVQRKVLDAIKGKPNDVAQEMAYSCVYCARCMKSCQLGLNPYHLQEILKAELVIAGCKPTLPKPQIGRKVYDLKEVVQFLQIKPSQISWLNKVPAHPKQADVVLFMGCSMRDMPEKSLALVELLEMMEMDFVALSGGTLCCGGRYLRSGDADKTDRVAGKFIPALNAFHPKKVAFTCGTCLYEVSKVFPAFTSVNFEPMHVVRLLAEEVHRLKFRKPVKARVAIHDPCNLSRKGGDVESARKLLSAVPGVTLVEMAHNKEDSLCCGSAAQETSPEIARTLRQRSLNEVRDTGAEIMATVCTGCHRSFSPCEKDFPFKIKNYINLVSEAAGLNYEDRLKKYLQMGDVDRIIKEAGENIEASPYSLEEYKKLLPLYFRPQMRAKTL